ncbi:hypothetical protein [Flavobacterium sp.]|uniref:hypothetical protein n=1 Tax=Flavobacterium sp. TaxID=239 RepID=UPI002607E5F5|nr:hypothetical protein [Flavobacterium sp.]
MKKTILQFALLLGFVSLYGNTISKKSLNSETVLDPWVEIYTQANYGGVRTIVTGATNTVNLPIPNTPGYKTISVKVQPGYVAYINTCNEFNDEVMIYGNRPSLTLYALCPITIKAERADFIRVQFQGFTTNIHNNDCRKIFGSVRLKMFENRPGGGTVTNVVTMQNGADVSTLNRIEALVFNRASASDTSLPNCVIPYVFDSSFVPNFNEAIVNQERTSGIFVVFVAGESAIAERRIGFTSNSNLRTAHKMNDFATYYSNIQLSPTLPMSRLITSLPNIPGSTSLTRDKILQFGFYSNPPQNSGDSGHLVKILMSVF